jgi:hypothetical protein
VSTYDPQAVDIPPAVVTGLREGAGGGSAASEAAVGGGGGGILSEGG